jgi:hypothetical protein
MLAGLTICLATAMAAHPVTTLRALKAWVAHLEGLFGEGEPPPDWWPHGSRSMELGDQQMGWMDWVPQQQTYAATAARLPLVCILELEGVGDDVSNVWGVSFVHGITAQWSCCTA